MDNSSYLAADFFGIQMWFTCLTEIAQIKDMFPLIHAISVSYDRIGVERKHTSCIFWWQACAQQTVVYPRTDLAAKCKPKSL